MAVGPFSIFKQRLRRCIVDSIYNEIITNSSRYYHWLGKENLWSDFLSPYIPSSDTDVPGPPQNNFRYDLHVRRDMLTLKRIETSDVSYVVRRINWLSGTVYDMYDDGITTPITSAKPWAPNAVVYEISENPDPAKLYVGDLIKYNGFYYKARTSGTLNSTPPTHASNGTTDGVVYGTVRLYYYTRDVIAPSGATSLEESNFYVLNSEYNVYKCIWNNNDKQSSSEPTGTDTDIVTLADGYRWKYLYTIPLAARKKFLTDQYMPVVNALKSQFYSTGQLVEVTIENEGTEYVDPILTVNGDGTGATLTAVVTDGQITSVIVDTVGQDYSYATILVNGVALSTATSSGTTATFTTMDNHMLSNGDQVTIRGVSNAAYDGTYTVTVTDDKEFTVTTDASDIVNATGGVADYIDLPGTGAVLQADFGIGNIDSNQANVELTAVPASIETYKVVDGGAGYVTAPVVTIQGDGTGATAVAQIAGGRVVQINPLTPGTGYTWTNIVLDGGGGSGATARAIMSPTYGHGSNAIDELNANSLMFFTSFSNDKNQGMVITNDYRKVGLVRNITVFDANDQNNRERFKLKLGSGCVKVKPQDADGNDLNPLTLVEEGKLNQDWLLLNVAQQYKKYRVIDYDNQFILLSVFNNFELQVGDELGVDSPPETGLSQESLLFTFKVAEITPRTVNQFSGDLLFLRVSEPFSEKDQSVTVRTVITI